MTFLAFYQIQRAVVQLVFKLSKNAGINDLLDLYVRNRRATFLIWTFDISLSFDISIPYELSEAKEANCMETFIQICEFLYLIDTDWVFAARINAVYLLVLVWWFFINEDPVFLKIVKDQSALPLLFRSFLDLCVFLAILKQIIKLQTWLGWNLWVDFLFDWFLLFYYCIFWRRGDMQSVDFFPINIILDRRLASWSNWSLFDLHFLIYLPVLALRFGLNLLLSLLLDALHELFLDDIHLCTEELHISLRTSR